MSSTLFETTEATPRPRPQPVRFPRRRAFGSLLANPSSATADLLKAIHRSVVPQLLRNRGLDHAPQGASRSPNPTARVESLASYALHADYEHACGLVDQLHRNGVTADALLSGLLFEAARRLDDWWHDDLCNAFETTLGICTLRTLAHHVASEGRGELGPSPLGGCVAMLAPPKDRIAFEPVLHECYLEMAGWHVDKLEGQAPEPVVDHCRQTHVDLVIYSMNDERFARGAQEVLVQIRRASKNPRVGIVGLGPVFEHCSGSPRAMGVDVVSHEPHETLSFVRCRAAA